MFRYAPVGHPISLRAHRYQILTRPAQFFLRLNFFLVEPCVKSVRENGRITTMPQTALVNLSGD